MVYEVLEFHDIPHAVAKKLLEKYSQKLGGNISELARVVMEYLDKVVRCNENDVEELYNELKKYGFKEVTTSMILNIIPQSIDELRTLMVFEESIPDENVLKNVVDMINERCGKREE